MRSIIAVFLWCLAGGLGVAHAGTLMTAKDVFMLSAARKADGSIELRWAIAPGNYLYRDKISAATEAGQALPLETAAGDTKDDPNFGTVEIYRNEARAEISEAALPANGPVRVSFQGCADQGICYPPVADSVDLTTLTVTQDERHAIPGVEAAAKARAGSTDLPHLVEPSASSGSPSQLSGGLSLLSGTLPLMFASFIGFGVLLAMTPCVFPMIPILAGLLAPSGERLPPSRALVLSGVYAVAIGLAYGVVGIVAAWSGQNLQSVLQTPVAIGAMAIVFIALALSMFGLYDLQLPSALAVRFIGGPQKRAGSVTGAALLGFGSALVVSPCVTPPLAAALLYVGETGDVLRGAIALFALGFGMGLPLIVFGTVGASILPKSGSWLVAVKQLFGIIFLALALSMLTRILPPTAGVGLWGAGFVSLGAFLIWSGGPFFRATKAFGTLGIVYGAILLVGFAAGATDPLRPLAFLIRQSSTGDDSNQRVVTSMQEYEQAVADARAVHRPILVDFTAEWCTTCKDIDREIFGDPDIRRRLRSLSLVKVDITNLNPSLQTVMDRLGVVGPPTLLILDPNTGVEVKGSRSIGELSLQHFGLVLTRAGA